MSETTDPGTTPDATPTESLQLADQQPVALAAPAPTPTTPAAAAPAGSHTRTILEVVGGVVAAGLIVVAGALGFLAGHASGDDGRWGMTDSRDGGQDGPDAGAPLGGRRDGQDRQGWGMPGMPGQGEQGLPGQDPRGIDPDGDNWTGGGQPG